MRPSSFFGAPRSRSRVLALSALMVVAACAPGWRSEPPLPATATAPLVHAVAGIGMTVANVDRSAAFFRDVLGFAVVSDVRVTGPEHARLAGVTRVAARVVRLRLGREELELTQYSTPRGRPFPQGSRSHDRWFQHVAIVVSDMDAAYERVRGHVRAVSSGPQVLPPSNVAAAGIAAFYFRDPDGHTLELIHFPPGKGDPRWQERTSVFLGIDHTAIGVGSTAASLGFYRDLLGLRIVGESLNVGTEQERLTGVAGARVRITGLRAAAGLLGIELLEYEAPRDGRTLPFDARDSDVVHWHTTLTVDDVDEATHRLRAAGHPVSVVGVVTLPRPTLGFTRAIVVRDPDGHVLRLVEP